VVGDGNRPAKSRRGRWRRAGAGRQRQNVRPARRSPQFIRANRVLSRRNARRMFSAENEVPECLRECTHAENGKARLAGKQIGVCSGSVLAASPYRPRARAGGRWEGACGALTMCAGKSMVCGMLQACGLSYPTYSVRLLRQQANRLQQSARMFVVRGVRAPLPAQTGRSNRHSRQSMLKWRFRIGGE